MSYWNEQFKIGTLSFPRFVGGPLDGITDAPFRRLVRKFSRSELLYTEMRHVASVAHDRGKVRALDFSQGERPLNYQVSASSVDFVHEACDRILAAGVDMVDLNIGCPARLVVNSGAGSALMGDLPRLKQILQAFRAKLSVPFTVKMRAGFKTKNAVEVAKLIEDCGVDAVAIHPRLQTQHFAGSPDYTVAAEVKRAISIPVILSGGVVNWSTAKMAYEQTGVDAYLIGRGIWSKPWKLHEMFEHSQGRQYRADDALMLACAVEHVESMVQYYGERGLPAFRKHLPFYVKGKPSASGIRQKLVISQSLTEVKEGLQQFFGA